MPVPIASTIAIAPTRTQRRRRSRHDHRSQAGPAHLPAQLGDVHRPLRVGRVGDDPAARQLDHTVATCAISRLWVTIRTAVPCSCVCSWSRSRICTPVWKSSSPVGSSASRIGLPPARARAIATRCCSPPESSCGNARSVPRARRARASSGLRRAGSRAPRPPRELDVLERRRRREQVERLEDEADLVALDAEELGAVGARDVLPAIATAPSVGESRAPIMFRSGSATEAEHHRELAPLQGQVRSPSAGVTSSPMS